MPGQAGQELTPEAIEKEGSDPQLAAAFKAITAKVTTGEYARAGQPLPDHAAQAVKPADVQKRRTDLLKNLQKLNEELEELNDAGSEGQVNATMRSAVRH